MPFFDELYSSDINKLVDIKKLSEFGWQNKLTLKEGLEQAYTFFMNRFKDFFFSS